MGIRHAGVLHLQGNRPVARVDRACRILSHEVLELGVVSYSVSLPEGDRDRDGDRDADEEDGCDDGAYPSSPFPCPWFLPCPHELDAFPAGLLPCE